MDSLKQKLSDIDRLIKEARWKEAQEALKAFRKGKSLPRLLALPFAKLCRRASIPETGIQALRPIVRPTGRQAGKEASEAEVNEYATLLIRIGACREAEGLLAKATAKSSTEVVHTLAYLNTKQWNYPSATRYFLEYISRPELDIYSVQIGRLNLAMSLIFEGKTNQAEDVIQAALHWKETENYPLVKANALRLLGVVEFYKKDYSEATRLLSLSSDLFPESNSIDRFLNQKWTGIVNYALKKADKASRKNIEELRRQAHVLRHWESIRDLDFHTASFDEDEEKLTLLYFGTPYEHYRKRILNHFPNLNISETISWRPSGSTERAKYQFDLASSGLKPGQAVYRLLSVLSSDFYHPFSIVAIFEHVFPGECYSPGSSEARVYMLIKRTRAWLKSEGIPLELVSEQNGIRFRESSCALTLRRDGTFEAQDSHRLNTIRAKLGTSFTIAEAVPLFEFSKRTLINLATKAVSDGILIRIGKGKLTRYHFADSDTSFRRAA